jgi:hypothetical protein
MDAFLLGCLRRIPRRTSSVKEESICWGNPAQQRIFAAAQSYRDALPHLATLDVDVLTFECAATDGMDLEMIGRTIQDKKIAVGGRSTSRSSDGFCRPTAALAARA